MQLVPPVLQLVPRSERLTYKVSVDGALLLKQGRFMKRYTGNKHVEIDINGKVWLNPKLLADAIKNAKVEKPVKKKPRIEMQGFQDFPSCEENQNSANLSTLQSGLQTNVNDLSPKPAKKYSVNKKEVPRRIMAMLNSQMGYRELYFVTVSFPPCITDALGIQLLNTWLTSLRKYRLVRQYLWVAERQKIGTIHFHICVPHFLNIHRANRMMAGCLKELHRKGVINYLGFAKYNGVDLAGSRPGGPGSKKQVTNFAGKQKSKALGWYLTKYVTKNATEFDNYAWHNSRGYTALHHGITLTDTEFEDRLQYHLQLNEFKVFEREFFCWAPWAKGQPPDAVQLELFKVNSYTQYLNGFFHPKDEGVISYAGDALRNEQTCYYNNLKKHNEMRTNNSDLKNVTLDEVRAVIITNEMRMIKAFTVFAGAEAFTKEFCDEVKLLIKMQVWELDMRDYFAGLWALICSESEKEFSYLYYLYCYWAVDLLNQISNT